VPSLLLRDKRDFAAKGALIIRGAVGARPWIWHQTLMSASPPFSTLPSTLDDRSVGFSRRRGGGTATNAFQGAMRVSGPQPDAAVSSRPDADVAHFDEGQQPRNDDSSIIEPIELESA
jgi:hypothetical protein